MVIRSLEFKKLTAVIKFENYNTALKNELIALSLINGLYNPMRKYSDNDMPLTMDQMEEYRKKFDTLIADIVYDMNLITDFEKIN